MTLNQFKNRFLIGIIGDEDSVTGLLLAGIGHIDAKQTKNFFIVDNKVSKQQIEEKVSEMLNRKDIAIILINQHVAEQVRELIDTHHEAFPTILEIPSKDHPYDPSKDSVLKRVQKLFGND